MHNKIVTIIFIEKNNNFRTVLNGWQVVVAVPICFGSNSSILKNDFLYFVTNNYRTTKMQKQLSLQITANHLE